MVEPGTPLPWGTDTNRHNTAIFSGEDFVCEINGVDAAAMADTAYIVRACNSYPSLLEALEDMCAAAEYWAGCDEGCTPDDAESEILGAGGAWPSLSYRKAREVASLAKGASA